MDDRLPEAGQNDASTAATAARPVLVTGFGPFPGVADNPSGRFARAVDGTWIDGVPVIGRVLPVDWRAAWPLLLDAVETHRPAALLMYGVATSRVRVEVERVARNVAAPKPDAVGGLPIDGCIEPDGPPTLDTTLPWQALVGPDVGVSDDAGDYLCNYVMFRSVYSLCNRVPHCGFVHLPARPTPGAYAVLNRMVQHLR